MLIRKVNDQNQQSRWGFVISLFGLLVLFSHVTYAEDKKLPVVSHVELDKYLGLWYEVARKPLYFQRDCVGNVTARYTLNENGNVSVTNRCLSKDGQLQQSIGEAFVQNAPFNTKLKVSFLPEAIRWLSVARGDYWILKIDDDYQTVLVGEPRRKYMWVLSRSAQPDQAVVNEYLEYAKSVGYNLTDLIHTKQTHNTLKILN